MAVMKFSFTKGGLSAVSLAVLIALATPMAPAQAQAVRDKVLSIVSESAKAAGATSVEWGNVSGSDAEFVVEDTETSYENEGKETSVSASKVVYSGAKPTADGGISADAITATDLSFEADDGSFSVASLKVTNYVGPSPAKIKAKQGGSLRFDRIEATGIEVTDEKEKTVPIAAITMTAADYVGDVPRKVGFEVKGVEVPVDAADESMKDLAELGYTKLKLDAALGGAWDDKTGRLVVDQLSVTGADIGGVKLAFTLGGLTPAVVEALKQAENDQAKQMELLQGLTVEKLSLRYEDASLAKRVLATQAKKQGVPADALVMQLSAMVPMLVSAIGNKDFETKISNAAAAFLKAPKSLTVSANPAKPTPVAEIMGAAMMAPQSLPTVLGADVKAND